MRKALYCMLICLAMLGLGSCKWFFKSPKVEQIHDIKVVSIDPTRSG